MTIIYWLWRLGSWCAGHTPLVLCRAFARGVGNLGYWLLPAMRGSASSNYGQVLGRPAGDKQVQQVTRQAFKNFALYLLDVMRFPYLSDAELARRVVLHDGE